MQTIQYNYTIPSVPQTNNSIIGKKIIKMVPCFDTTPNPNLLCGLWNDNRCPNDDSYCNPFVKGDKIYLQYIIARDIKHVTFEVIDNKTGESQELTAVKTPYQLGVDENETNFLNLIVDTSQFDLTCFYLKLNLYKCDLTANKDYTDCLAQLIEEGQTRYMADVHCSELNCTYDQVDNIFSEPYCLVKCEKTLLIEGFYPKYDCNKNYYGLINGVANYFKPSIRIYGEINQTEYNFEETLVNRKRIKSRQIQAFILQTKKLPKYVVDIMAVCFNSQNLYIDGVEYLRPLNLSKNFEEGSMWIVKSTLLKECDEINFTCD